ncbi:YncE family protein [Roseomonas xinghualingensis]|uniref:YncE family protein n=1 Tax=Roseomonas xinghualingensis TaxID=2986475 RepID=UPI0021F10365|nr:YncE family protein [Roseomonas sp. SXEYE001]MCV4206543.1 YncE family protein [Roseomonas sp. SXEYE001]
MSSILTRPGTLPRRSLLGLATGLALEPATRLQAQTANIEARTSPKLAPSLYELVVSATIDRVLVASAGTREGGAAILAVDPRSLAVTNRMDLPEAGFGLGLNDRSGRLYIGHTRSGAVSVLDIHTGKIVARLAEGEGAHLREVAVDEANNRVFVSAFARDKPSAIWVIDGAAHRIAHVITEGMEGGITGLALDAGRGLLYATALTSNEILEIKIPANRVLRRFPSGGEGTVNLACDAAGRRIFATNQRSNTLTVLDAATGALIRSVPVGEGALGVAFNPDNQHIYVANRRAGTVSVVDGRRLEVIASPEVGTHPNTIAIDRRSGLAYVTNKARQGRRGEAPPEDPKGDTLSVIQG